jgi:hypothetical protein
VGFRFLLRLGRTRDVIHRNATVIAPLCAVLTLPGSEQDHIPGSRDGLTGDRHEIANATKVERFLKETLTRFGRLDNLAATIISIGGSDRRSCASEILIDDFVAHTSP